jgi:hypothetical protein
MPPSPLPSLSLPKPPVSKDGAIEIRYGNAIMRIEGSVDATVLSAVLGHFHP